MSTRRPTSAEDWDRRYADREFAWTREANRFLVQEAGELAPARALDLACGEGRNAVWLAQQGWLVTGVDFSRVGVERAQLLASARGVECQWVLADLTDYEPTERAFDLVTLLYLQVAASERAPVVNAAASAVADGGTLLVVAHDSANLDHGYGGPQDATVLYTAGDVVADLDGTGLHIERAERVRRPVQTDDGERIALDALVTARR